jgi:GTPase SAR1 family protein
MYYRGVHGVVLVCDVTSLESFKALESWLDEFLQKQDRSVDCQDIAFLLLGNKTDLKDKAVVTEKDLNKWVSE